MPGNILYPGYKDKIRQHLKLDLPCPDGYMDMMPTDTHCYRFATKQPPVPGETGADRLCKTAYGGQLTKISSFQLKTAYVQELVKLKLKHVLVRLKLNLSMRFVIIV